MTRENAIMELKIFSGTTQLKLSANFWTALNMSIKTLEQQPSEDCVSRTQAIEFVNEVIGGKNDFADAIRDGVVAVLSALPPVTPTRKKGEWIKRENINGLEQYYQCSNCGNHCLYEYVEIGFKNAKTKYCPNCGAEMESEDKR